MRTLRHDTEPGCGSGFLTEVLVVLMLPVLGPHFWVARPWLTESDPSGSEARDSAMFRSPQVTLVHSDWAAFPRRRVARAPVGLDPDAGSATEHLPLPDPELRNHAWFCLARRVEWIITAQLHVSCAKVRMLDHPLITRGAGKCRQYT